MNLKIVNKDRFIFAILMILIVLIIIIALILTNKKEEKNEAPTQNLYAQENKNQENETKKEITDWRLTLVNIDNALPEDYQLELVDIDQYRKFDARAIDELKNMIEAERKSGASGLWVQSGYRSIEYQKEVFDRQVQEYKIKEKRKKKQKN